MSEIKKTEYALEAGKFGVKKRSTRRSRPVRAKTIPVKKMSKEQIELGKLLYPEIEYMRPKSREDCLYGERPCPFVSCKYHLYLDVNTETGSIKVNFPDSEVWELRETCSLDVAERGGVTLEEVGVIMNLTRERIRQLETSGLTKVEDADDQRGGELRKFA